MQPCGGISVYLCLATRVASEGVLGWAAIPLWIRMGPFIDALDFVNQSNFDSDDAPLGNLQDKVPKEPHGS